MEVFEQHVIKLFLGQVLGWTREMRWEVRAQKGPLRRS